MEHLILNNGSDSAALAEVALKALREARNSKTSNSGSIFVSDGQTDDDGIALGTGTIINGVNGGIQPWVGDTTPPGKPTGLSVSSKNAAVFVNWDGSMNGGKPLDWGHLHLLAKDDKGNNYDFGVLYGAGSQQLADLTPGAKLTVWAIGYDDAHDAQGNSTPNASTPSDKLTVTVESAVDPKDVEKAQSDAQDALNQAGQAKNTANIALANAQELVRNPTMRNDVDNPDGWPGSVTLGSSGAPSNPPTPFTTYAKVTGRDHLTSWTLPNIPGRVLQYTIYVVADSTATQMLQFGVQYSDTGIHMHWDPVITVTVAQGQSGWAKYVGTFTVPDIIGSDTNWPRPWLEIDGGASDSGWYVTGLSIKDITEAQAAQKTADGKNKIFSSASEPSRTGIVPGDMWFQLDANKNVSGIQVWNGSAFTDMVLLANELLVASSVGTTQIADNAIVTGKIAANAITAIKIAAQSITGDKLDVGSVAAAIITSGLFKTADGRYGFDSTNGFWAGDTSGMHLALSNDSYGNSSLAIKHGASVISSLNFNDTISTDGYVHTGITTGQNGQFLEFATLVDHVNHQADPLSYDVRLVAADGTGLMNIDAQNAVNVNGTWFAHSVDKLPVTPRVVGGAGTKAFAKGVDYVFDGAGAWSRATPRTFRYTVVHTMSASAGDLEYFPAVASSTLLSDLGHPIDGQYAPYVTFSACVQDNGMVRAMSVDNNGAINIRTISNGPGTLRFGITVMDWS